VTLLAASLATLPITPSASWKPTGNEDPSFLIVALLALSIGLPYFLLSTTGPLVQAWFTRERPGAVPYRLFALSNFGSMLALLTYPLVFEPSLPVRLQSSGWSAAYTGFALICGALACRGLRRDNALRIQNQATAGDTLRPRILALWAALAACPSILLMAVTTHVTQNVAPIPLLWVLPLSLYLLSFILCFEGKAWYRRIWYIPLLVLALGGMSYGLLVDITDAGAWPAIGLYCGGLFIACMVCHGELAKLKPDPQHLTVFYLMLATGGAVGGLFVAIIAPRYFNGDYELSLGIVVTAALVVGILFRDSGYQFRRLNGRLAWFAMTGLTVVLASTLAYGAAKLIKESRLMARNFYGTLSVSESGEGKDLQRALYHGAIIHGEQYLADDRRRWATTYYGENTGIGLAILASRNIGAQRVGVIGLGAGTLAAFGRAGDYYRFYEINPLVIQLARSEFTFMADSPAKVEVALGDARLSMEREQPQNFDVLVVDAFSGDSIPVHLLTREAFGLYFRHLRPGGILAVHISNKYLDLAPVVKLAADYYSKKARLVDSDDDDEKDVYTATWILVSDRPDIFSLPMFKDIAQDIKVPPALQPWTDDFSSIYKVLK
jgi:SAM-dependent methyltransferase